MLMINGREQEIYLAGVIVKLGYRDNAIALLNLALSVKVAYPRCTDPACFEVELFADKNQSSVNCQLIESGIALPTKVGMCLGSPAATSYDSGKHQKAIPQALQHPGMFREPMCTFEAITVRMGPTSDPIHGALLVDVRIS